MATASLKKTLKKTHSVNLTFEVANETLGDILSGCFQSGSGYWLKSVEVEDEYYGGAEYKTDVPACGGYLLLREYEGRKIHKLGYRELLVGIMRYGHEQKKFDFDNMDAIDYDFILQYSIFGKIKYS